MKSRSREIGCKGHHDAMALDSHVDGTAQVLESSRDLTLRRENPKWTGGLDASICYYIDYASNKPEQCRDPLCSSIGIWHRGSPYVDYVLHNVVLATILANNKARYFRIFREIIRNLNSVFMTIGGSLLLSLLWNICFIRVTYSALARYKHTYMHIYIYICI